MQQGSNTAIKASLSTLINLHAPVHDVSADASAVDQAIEEYAEDDVDIVTDVDISYDNDVFINLVGIGYRENICSGECVLHVAAILLWTVAVRRDKQ